MFDTKLDEGLMGIDPSLYTPKRPKILNEEDENNLFLVTTTKMECEFCHLEIDYGDRWIHFNRHQQGINQPGRYEHAFDEKSVRFPWYMHSIYQDRSVNRSRYEVLNFTELSNSSSLIEFERLITKPIRTHFWINYNKEKTGDSVKDYFALSPKAVSYESYDNFGSEFATEIVYSNDHHFHCSVCNRKFRKCPSLIQSAMQLLIHLLGDHPKHKDLCAAALEDLKSIQEATGVRTYLDKPPNEYKPILGHDFVFDPLYSREFMMTYKPAAAPTYCLLCFKEVSYYRPYYFGTSHARKVHNISSIETCIKRIMCLPASRYGQPESIWCKNFPIPLAMIQSEDKSIYTWACPICKLFLKNTDALQMSIYIIVHMSSLTGDCQSVANRIASLIRSGMGVIYHRMDEITKALDKVQMAIGLWNTMFKPVTLLQIIDQCFSVEVEEIYKKWIMKLDDKNVGFVRIDGELREIERKYQSLKQTMKIKRNRIYICPFCYQYLPLSEHMMCHLKPGQCSKMANFNIKLDQTDMLKAEKMVEKWNSC